MPRYRLLLPGALFGVLACGGADDPTFRPGSLEASLEALGVALDRSPRTGPGGQALDDDDAPLGARATVDRIDELVLGGLRFQDGETLTVLDMRPNRDVSVLHRAPVDAAWAETDFALAAADVNGDGVEEILVGYVRDTSAVVEILDPRAGFSGSTEVLSAVAPDARLRLQRIDADGDGDDDLALVAEQTGEVHLGVAEANGDDLRVIFEDRFPTRDPGARGQARLAAGNLDVDNGEELVILLNDGDAASSYRVLDDAQAGFSTLHEGTVVATSPDTGSARSAVRSGIDVGDVDGDGLDEIVLAGLETTDRPSCSESFRLALVVVDDAAAGFAPLAQGHDERQYRPCSSVSPWRMGTVFVGAFDLDGDGVDEVHVNDAVYDDLGSGRFVETWTLPETAFLPVGATNGGRISEGYVATVTGDFDQDGRQEVAVYNENGPDFGATLIFGLDGPEGVNGFGLLARLDTGRTNADRPTLLAANVDEDSVVVSYENGTHAFGFTEPQVIAVLAAPPCHGDLDRSETGACTTAFGQGELSGSMESTTTTYKVNGHVGLELGGEILDIGVKVRATKQWIRERTETWSSSYEVEKRITYTTGHLEDAVIFTSTPVDQYTYTVKTHPDPDLVGTVVTISLPREPITIIADRTYFNANLHDPSKQIDERVLPHTPGDVGSYVPRSELSRLAPAGWLSSPEITVGQGLGNTEMLLTVTESERTGSGSLEGSSYDVELTFSNVILGVSWGRTDAESFVNISGTTSLYRGQVGSFDAADYGDRYYSTGMFVYERQLGDGQPFEVVNYWVEPGR